MDAAGHQRRAQRHCGVHHGRVFVAGRAAPALERSRGLRRAEPCADNEPVCIRHQAGGRGQRYFADVHRAYFVLLYLWLAKGQKPPRAAVAACVLVFAGIGCFVADGLAAGTLLGNALGLGSGVAYAGVFLVNTEPEGDAMSSYFLGQVAGALIGLPFLSGETDFSFVPMVCIFALGVFQLGLSYVLIARGIATTPPMTASLVTAIEPILTPVWVALAYGERLSGFSLAGAVLVLCSVVWFNTRGRKAL